MATTQMTSPCRPEASNMATVPSRPIARHFQRLALSSGWRARATAYTAINAPVAERPLEWVYGATIVAGKKKPGRFWSSEKMPGMARNPTTATRSRAISSWSTKRTACRRRSPG